jgi:hypothetical protein
MKAHKRIKNIFASNNGFQVISFTVPKEIRFHPKAIPAEMKLEQKRKILSWLVYEKNN